MGKNRPMPPSTMNRPTARFAIRLLSDASQPNVYWNDKNSWTQKTSQGQLTIHFEDPSRRVCVRIGRAYDLLEREMKVREVTMRCKLSSTQSRSCRDSAQSTSRMMKLSSVCALKLGGWHQKKLLPHYAVFGLASNLKLRRNHLRLLWMPYDED